MKHLGLLWLLSFPLLACAQQATPEPRAAGSCGSARKPGLSEHALTHGDRAREYLLYVPKAYDGRTRLPLIVGLHGGWATPENFIEQTGFNPAAEAAGFLAVYPKGMLRAWNAGRCCAAPVKQHIDDVGFIAAVVRELEAMACADGERVYGTGFSNGAMMIHRIACERPGLFAAIAPVAGGLMTDACAAKPTPALLIQGRGDERIPWEGGTVEGTYRPAMKEVVAQLAARNACGTDENVLPARGSARCAQRSGCKAELVWCGVEKVGHQWPGGKTYLPRKLGPNTQDYEATQAILEFFKQH